MAKEYFDRLFCLINELKLKDEASQPIEIKHFFSGAALYAGGTICASLSPVGLAFKLTEKEVNDLITGGKAFPLKYFDKGHVKKGYALFKNPDRYKPVHWKKYFIKSINQI